MSDAGAMSAWTTVADASEAIAGLQARLGQRLIGTPAPRVLDAGCGARRYVTFGDAAYVIGLDVSAEDLERNNAIDQRIIGNLETFPLESQSFDIVLCWDVLEHLQHPRQALGNLCQTARKGGLLVLAGPNALSFKGMATWITPYWFHRIFYRAFVKGPHEPPFKTYRRTGTTPGAILAWARLNSLTLEYAVSYESWIQQAFRKRLGIAGRRWSAIRTCVRFLTFALVDLEATDFVLLLSR